MKSNLTKTVLDWALATSLILSIVFFIQFLNRTRAIRTSQPILQTELARFQGYRMALNALAVESFEYSKQHPALKPVLQSVGITQSNATPPSAAGAKPAAK